MPFGLHKHSNRSKQALNDSSLQGTSFHSSGGSTEEFAQYSNNTYLPPSGNSSTDDLEYGKFEDQGRRQSGQKGPGEHKKSKSIFDRMRPGGSGSGSQADPKPPTTPTQSNYHPTGGLGRRLSKRKENPPAIRTVQRDSFEQSPRPDWQSTRSPTYLPSPRESPAEEVDLDPYLIRDSEVQNYRPEQEPQRPRFSAEDYESPRYLAQQQHAHHQEHQALVSPKHHEQAHQPHIHPQHQTNISINSMNLDPYRLQQHENAETVSQLSYESPTEQYQEQRPGSVQSNEPSPADTSSSQRIEYPSRASSIQAQESKIPQGPSMAPPASASQQPRRTDMKQSPSGTQGQPDPRDMPLGYRQSSSSSSNTQMPPLVSSAGSQPPNYSRGGSGGQTHPYSTPGGEPPRGASEQGRSTPPPAPSERDIGEAYKELSQKYKKVKGLYFDKTSQVEQLQNTLANQRLSQSRTSLDDNEYMTRFQRLDGAITNLAFNIRKDWKAVPSWIAPFVNQDATRIGRQEMTAVGRAYISRFLVDEVFTRVFHPGLDVELSGNLKAIELNIRRFHSVTNNQEEADALTSKVVQWRLATLDGLRDVLSSPEAEECRKQFVKRSTTNLVAHLINYLVEPTPPGIEDSAHMIVELAVSVVANLPLESRDISIIYPMPGDFFSHFIMRPEAGLPALENPGFMDTGSEVDASSIGSGDKDEMVKESEKGDGKLRKEKPKGPGMLSAMMGSQGPSKKVVSPGGMSEVEGKLPRGSMEDVPQRVRFAGFMGVEVKGRQVLVKSPVWTIS